MEEFFRELGEFRVVVEATAAYEWFVRSVEQYAKRVVLAHPRHLRVIAESTRKSDKIDAEVLALFLCLDMIPEAYRPTPFQQEYRRLVRLRHAIQGRITSAKCRIRYLLSTYNKDRKDLFTREGSEYLKRTQRELSQAARFTLTRYRQELKLFEEQLGQTEKELGRFVKKAPKRIQEARALLQSIPGVGPVTVDVVLSERGDVDRFSSQKKLCSYAGLAPGSRESGEHWRGLSITKRGSCLLRWVLIEAAWNLVGRSPKWARIHEKLAGRMQKKKAIVAVARRLLCLMMSMVQNGRAYSVTA